jgi:hypothetical protein
MLKFERSIIVTERDLKTELKERFNLRVRDLATLICPTEEILVAGLFARVWLDDETWKNLPLDGGDYEIIYRTHQILDEAFPTNDSILLEIN